METTLQGTIHGRHIELDCDAGIPEGSRVRLRIEPVTTLSDAEKLKRILALFRELGKDETLVKALEAAYNERKGEFPREVRLDVAP